MSVTAIPRVALSNPFYGWGGWSRFSKSTMPHQLLSSLPQVKQEFEPRYRDCIPKRDDQDPSPTNKALTEQSGRAPPRSSADTLFVAWPLLSVSVLSSAPYLVVRCLRGLFHMPSWGGEAAHTCSISPWPAPAPSPACCREEPNRFPWNLLLRLSDEAPSGLHYGLRRKLRARTQNWPPVPVCRKGTVLFKGRSALALIFLSP